MINLKEVNLPTRHNLNPVSNVYEAVVISLFWAYNRLNELPEIHLEFPLNLIGKLTGQSWHVLKSLYTGWSPEQRF